MQTAKILLALGGDAGNTVPKVVTAAEIAVLRAIHGTDAVTDIEPANDVERSNRAELGRLRGLYGRAMDGENQSILAALFPGAAARVHETLEELELDPSFFKPLARATAKPFGGKGDHDRNGTVGGAAKPLKSGVDGMTIAQLKAHAAENNIDLGEATKRDDILALVKAADAPPTGADGDAEGEGDGVGDMTDTAPASTEKDLFT
jgi:hypothetical protein